MLALCAGSIYLCFLGYGYLHEALYKSRYGVDGERFTHSLLLVACQSVGNCAFAAARQQQQLHTHRTRTAAPAQPPPHPCCRVCLLSVCAVMLLMKQPVQSVPWLDYVQIAFSYIGAMYSSNLALNYMSYPAQSLAKSCKLIPVMLMRVLVLGKRYALHEYLQVLLITAGICAFMMFEDGHKGGGGKEEGSSTSAIGFLLCLLSLALDGFTGPTQERINAQHHPSMAQMMFFLNLYAVLLVAALLLITGQLWTGLTFFARTYHTRTCTHHHTTRGSASSSHFLTSRSSCCVCCCCCCRLPRGAAEGGRLLAPLRTGAGSSQHSLNPTLTCNSSAAIPLSPSLLLGRPHRPLHPPSLSLSLAPCRSSSPCFTSTLSC